MRAQGEASLRQPGISSLAVRHPEASTWSKVGETETSKGNRVEAHFRREILATTRVGFNLICRKTLEQQSQNANCGAGAEQKKER